MSARIIASLTLFVALGLAADTLADQRMPGTIKVVIDDWWGRDFSATDCNVPAYAARTPQGRAACKDEAIGEYNNFRQRLLTYFAADRECAGIVIVPMTERATWSLMLDYQPTLFGGSTARSWWSMVKFGSIKDYEGDKDTPREIARHVCSIALRRGAVEGVE